MDKREFIKKGLTLGAGLPFLSTLLQSCGEESLGAPLIDTNFSGNVIIIGAGAAGMTAAYLLQRNNIPYEVIEAAPVIGGRVKRIQDFADFPIDLGAEWIHTDPSILSEIVNDPTVTGDIDFITYNPQTIHLYKNGKVRERNWFNNFYSEWKFKNTTWFGFFERFILPSIEDNITLDLPVTSIDSTGSTTTVTTADGNARQADRVIVTVPIKILQDEVIEFRPALSAEKREVIDNISMDDGLKVFIEFKERFYPDALLFGSFIEALTSDEKTYYNAAFRKGSNRNILGLFTINDEAARYTSLGSDERIIEEVISELDEMFDGQASQHYQNHVIQNWSAEPYIRGSYSYTFSGSQNSMVDTLKAPIDNKIYFAGEALSIDAQATVHGASESAYDTVRRMLEG
ncbi:MAG: NAD(P)/FAD-dependent oxidoreductase [Bacteroidota bacterium]